MGITVELSKIGLVAHPLLLFAGCLVALLGLRGLGWLLGYRRTGMGLTVVGNSGS
jgi:hypothetical protein